MREVTFTLDKLNTGLRTDDSQPINSPGLLELYNLKPGPLGLSAYEAITNRKGSLTFSWPYPILFVGTNYKFILTSTTLYTVASNWAQTSQLTTTAGYLWDFLDLGTYCIFTNGTKMIVRDAIAGTYSAINYNSTMPRFSTGCVFNGQLVVGNIKTTWHGCGTCSVIWSSIGTNDFTPGVNNIKGSVNEAGFRTQMHWNGEVFKVRQLGNAIVIYGDNGIGSLFPSNEYFGYRELKSFGLASRNAVAGDKNKHLIVASDGTLQLVTFKVSAYGSTYEEITELGYSEFISTMTLANIVVSYDPRNDEFYISDGVKCFLLTTKGLCQIFQLVTSVYRDSTGLNGVTYDTTDTEARLTTDVYDFQERGIKTVMGLELGSYHPSGGGTYSGYGRIDYKYDKSVAITTGVNILLNPSGVMTQPSGGIEFKFGCKFTNYINVKLDYLKVDVKMTDRRFMRGPAANNLVQVTE